MTTRLSLVVALGVSLYACGDGPTRPQPQATRLAVVVEPSRTEGTVAISPSPQVAVLDQFGNVDATATTPITVSLGANPGGTTLAGTVTTNAVAGVATFGDLRLGHPASGYTLVATAPGLSSDTSAAFDIKLTFVQLDAGNSHTCGVTIVAAAYCWGAGGGRVGDGTIEQRLTPTPVVGGLRFLEVSAGGSHSCGVTTEHVAYCWGSGFDGQLGNGTIFSGSSTPSAVSGGLSFATISAGHAHSCGVTTGSVAYCWGSNVDGRLGDGTTDTRATPTLVSGALSFAQVSAGGFHSCGVTPTGTAYCWGENFGGQLGDGSNTTSLTPTMAQGNLVFERITTGFVHTCGITAGRLAYCWGFNPAGQLGDGTTTLRETPTPVSGGLSFAEVSGGSDHTCAVTTGNVAYCWGFNDYGRLGDGTSVQHNAPNPVSGALRFAYVGAGFLHSCGLTTDNVVYCWGGNANGQHGNGTTNDSLVPLRVAH